MTGIESWGCGPLSHLGDLPVEEFLRDYWQKKPLLIRNAFPQIPVIASDELAGFSLEPEVESRVLIESPDSNPLESQWQLHQGPFDEEFYAQLPPSHWTLLVQAVDQLHPQIHQLLHRFRFIPNWRVDDVMVSYAADRGNVGPHFDYYDVFLLQATGSRRWRLGQWCSATSELRRDTDCKVLSHFDTSEQWLVEPGDMLYIPPNLAHWGVAEGECMTYSVGFRAPSYSDILLEFCQDVSAELTEDQRFGDAGRPGSRDPGEITDTDIERLRHILKQTLLDDRRLQDWFGRFMTQAQRQSLEFDDETGSGLLRLSPATRAAYFPTASGKATLYINGEQLPCSLDLAQRLCDYQGVEFSTLSTADQALLQELIDNSWVR